MDFKASPVIACMMIDVPDHLPREECNCQVLVSMPIAVGVIM